MPGDKDLDSVGLPSTSNVQDMLDTAEDPRQAIAEFQEQNALLLPSLKPVLKILELHGVRKIEYHQLVLNTLSSKLLEKVKELGSSKNPEDIKKLEMQLERSFKLYHVPKIRPIVLETLSRLPKVNNKILKKIVEDEQFYEECSVSVKQQIWLIKDELFVKAVDIIVNSYLDDKEKILTSRPSTNFFTCDTTKSRRQWKQIKDLIVMIGNHEKLYQKLLNNLREKFTETESPHYCSLRLELLMAIHDLNVDYAVKIDKAHDISWCLDACVRDRHMDVQQTAKLKALLDKKKLTEENIADISFVLSDSHTMHFLCSSAIKILCENARNCNGLPRENGVLLILLRLLYLANSASRFINGEEVEQKADINACLTRFIPLFSQFISRDFFRAELLLKRAQDDIADEFASKYEFQAPNESLINFVKTDSICALLWFHYTLQLLSKRNVAHSKEMFENCLRVACKSNGKVLMKEPWSSLLTHYLTRSQLTEQNINDERFSKIILHDYYMRGINHNSNNRFHLLHLCSIFITTIVSDELIAKVLKAVNNNGSLTTFFGLSSAKRFENEFKQFVLAVQNKTTMEASNEVRHIDIPMVEQPNDLLSAMQFDD